MQQLPSINMSLYAHEFNGKLSIHKLCQFYLPHEKQYRRDDLHKLNYLYKVFLKIIYDKIVQIYFFENTFILSTLFC